MEIEELLESKEHAFDAPIAEEGNENFHEASFEMLQKSDITNQERLRAVLDDPLPCGFVKAFSLKEFNAENLLFIIAVQEYKRCFHDAEFAGTEESYKHHAQLVWVTFCCEDSRHEISLDAKTLQHTQHMMETNVCEELFDKALMLAEKTLMVDVIPRFVRSPYFSKYVEIMSSETITAEPRRPEGEIEFISREPRDISLSQVLLDSRLYSLFLEDLNFHNIEYAMLCWQEIVEFKRKYSEMVPSTQSWESWSLYKNFCMHGSPHEVPRLTEGVVKKIALSIASPEIRMFDAVEKIVHRVLRDRFKKFVTTELFSNAVEEIKAKQKRGRSCILQ
jgi:hypothetical protein